MRYLVAILSLLLILPLTSNADDILFEGFDTPSGWWGSPNPPTGWSISDDGDQSEADWHQTNGGPSPPCAYIGWNDVEFPMADSLCKDDIDCSDYENCTLSYWLELEWYSQGYYSGIFRVIFYNNTSSTTLMNYPWLSLFYGTASFNVSGIADNANPVGIWLELWVSDCLGTDGIYLDMVHLEGDHTAVQPTSVGKIKAMFE